MSRRPNVCSTSTSAGQVNVTPWAPLRRDTIECSNLVRSLAHFMSHCSSAPFGGPSLSAVMHCFYLAHALAYLTGFAFRFRPLTLLVPKYMPSDAFKGTLSRLQVVVTCCVNTWQCMPTPNQKIIGRVCSVIKKWPVAPDACPLFGNTHDYHSVIHRRARANQVMRNRSVQVRGLHLRLVFVGILLEILPRPDFPWLQQTLMHLANCTLFGAVSKCPTGSS